MVPQYGQNKLALGKIKYQYFDVGRCFQRHSYTYLLDTAERITLLQMFIKHFGKSCIKGVLADREFVGKAWFGWLL